MLVSVVFNFELDSIPEKRVFIPAGHIPVEKFHPFVFSLINLRAL